MFELIIADKTDGYQIRAFNHAGMSWKFDYFFNCWQIYHPEIDIYNNGI